MLKYIFGILALCGAMLSCSGPNIKPEMKVSFWELDTQFGWFVATDKITGQREPVSIPENITFKSFQKLEILDQTLDLLRQAKAEKSENPLSVFGLFQFSFVADLNEVFEKTEPNQARWKKNQKFSNFYLAAVKSKTGDRKPSSVVDLQQEALQSLANDIFDHFNGNLQLVEGRDWSDYYYFIAKQGCQSPCSLSILKVMQRPWFNKTKFTQSAYATANGFELTGVYSIVKKDYKAKPNAKIQGDWSEVSIDSESFLSQYELIDQKTLVFISKK